jgi:hypothetical protein
MPRWILLIVVVVFGAGAMACAFLAQREEPARGLIAVEPVHDFGELSQGDKVSCEFELVNRVEQPLTIRNVIKSCGCTKAECSRHELAPSEGMSIQAEWDVGARRGHSGVEMTVVTALADGRLTATNLEMTATIVPDIVYEPEELIFDPDSPPQMVTFSPGRMKEFSLKRAYCTHRALEARLLPDGPRVEVVYHADALLEDVPTLYLMVETTSPHEPVCHIPLTMKRRGKIGGK